MNGGKKLIRQITIRTRVEAIAVILQILEDMASYDIRQILRTVCAHFNLKVVDL